MILPAWSIEHVLKAKQIDQDGVCFPGEDVAVQVFMNSGRELNEDRVDWSNLL